MPWLYVDLITIITLKFEISKPSHAGSCLTLWQQLCVLSAKMLSAFVSGGHSDSTACNSVLILENWNAILYCSDEMFCAALRETSSNGHMMSNDTLRFHTLFTSYFPVAPPAFILPLPSFPAPPYRFLVLPLLFCHDLASLTFRHWTKEGTKKRQMERRNQEETDGGSAKR